MIPKIIHYCWFGGNPLSEDAKRYIATWRKYCPGYEIKEWNETNFDIDQNRYCKEAYNAKKWAFVSDYVRLKVLYDFGGIYMDTDVEVLKPLDEFSNYGAWIGFQSENQLSTCVIASVKQNKWIGDLLDCYSKLRFINSDGSYNMTTNVDLITDFTHEKYKLNFNNSFQIFMGNNAVFPFEYFCAKDLITEKYFITENTYAVHHFNGSWMNLKGKLKSSMRVALAKIFGRKTISVIKIFLQKWS